MSFQYVKVYHGPCNTFHTLKHKPQMLMGLRDRLKKLGYRVELIAVDYVNYCMVEMCAHEIFRCNITNLQFNTHIDRDPVCQRAVNAVLEATTKFKHARAHIWLWTYIEHQLFKRGLYGPKDYWPEDVEIKPYASCKDCVECCKICVTRKTNEELGTAAK